MKTLDFKGALYMAAAAVSHFALHQKGATIVFLLMAVLYWTARDMMAAWKESA